MVKRLAEKLALSIKNQSPDNTASIAVMKFALEGLINSTIVLVLILAIGLLTGRLWECFLAAMFFMVLRFFSGGYHFRSSLQCTIVSVGTIILAVFWEISSVWLLILTIASIIILISFAPSNIENHARIPKKYFFVLKLISIGIVCLNFWLRDSAVGMAMFVQALLTLPFLNDEKEVKA